MEFLKALAKVFFGIAPLLTALAKALFPDQTDKADAADKVIGAVKPVVESIEQQFPQEGMGTAKKAIAMGEVAKVALQQLGSISTGGQKEFIDRILPAASQTIDGIVKATNEVAQATANDPVLNNLQ